MYVVATVSDKQNNKAKLILKNIADCTTMDCPWLYKFVIVFAKKTMKIITNCIIACCLNIELMYLLLFIFICRRRGLCFSVDFYFLNCHNSQNFSNVFVGSRQIFVNMLLFLHCYSLILR